MSSSSQHSSSSSAHSTCSKNVPSLKGSLYLDLVTLQHEDNGPERSSEEEYFFLVEKDKREQDIGGLLHIVGSGTPEIYLQIMSNFCPMKTKQYVRRQYLGEVTGEIPFLEIVNYAPLCVTKTNTKIDRAIYKRWKQDMIRQALIHGVLKT